MAYSVILGALELISLLTMTVIGILVITFLVRFIQTRKKVRNSYLVFSGNVAVAGTAHMLVVTLGAMFLVVVHHVDLSSETLRITNLVVGDGILVSTAWVLKNLVKLVESRGTGEV